MFCIWRRQLLETWNKTDAKTKHCTLLCSRKSMSKNSNPKLNVRTSVTTRWVRCRVVGLETGFLTCTKTSRNNPQPFGPCHTVCVTHKSELRRRSALWNALCDASSVERRHMSLPTTRERHSRHRSYITLSFQLFGSGARSQTTNDCWGCRPSLEGRGVKSQGPLVQ